MEAFFLNRYQPLFCKEWDLATRYKRLATTKHLSYEQNFYDQYFYPDLDSNTVPPETYLEFGTQQISTTHDTTAIQMTVRGAEDKQSTRVIEIPNDDSAESGIHDIGEYESMERNDEAPSGDGAAALEFENQVALLLSVEEANAYREKSRETDIRNEWSAYYNHVVFGNTVDYNDLYYGISSCDGC